MLIVLYFLTPRSELSSNITAPALFRYIEDVRPTLLIDEADSFVNDNEELRGILSSGHTKAAANMIRNVDHKPRRFGENFGSFLIAPPHWSFSLRGRGVTS
jgi:putative DNA primase/helicase